MTTEKFYPLRPIQRFFIDTHFKKAKSTMMNVGMLLKLSPVVDMQRLADAVNAVLNAHDIFRCRLTINPDTEDICQTFDGEIVEVQVEKTSDEEFELLRKKRLETPYKIMNQPLYHIYLFETPNQKYFYVDFYHAVMDSVSIMTIFQRELNFYYLGRYLDKPESYAQFVEEESITSPAELETGHNYWRNLLADFDAEKNLPTVDVENVLAWTKGTVDGKFKSISEEFFRTTRFGENKFFLAAFMLTLAKVTDSKKVFATWLDNGRGKDDKNQIMGLTTNIFPCAWDFAEDMTFENFFNIFSGKIRQELDYKKSLDIVYNEGLAADVPSFMFQKNIFTDHFTIGNTTATVADMPPNEISAAQNSIDIKIFAGDDGMYKWRLTYDAGRFSAESMKNFVAALEEILRVIQNKDVLISQILK